MKKEINIPVLDHGFVRLVEYWGGGDAGVDEAGIIEAARQSTQGNFRGWDVCYCPDCDKQFIAKIAAHNDRTGAQCFGKLANDTNLLNFMFKNRHSTPFEFAGMIIEVRAPIFVFREWHRHRTQCVSGSTPLVFNRPVDGKAYRKSMLDVVSGFLNPKTKARISAMQLRNNDGFVNVTGAWHTGQKQVYLVRTKYGEVEVSEDHLFKTPYGSGRLKDGITEVMAMIQNGDRGAASVFPAISNEEIMNEEWREVSEGYEVSNLGRVRSYWSTRGVRKQRQPYLKTQTVNTDHRAVVSINNKTVQVSVLVANAFLGRSSEWVLHKNDNPLDNRLLNLKLGTAQDNADDSQLNGGRKRLREVPVKILSINALGLKDTFDISVTGNNWFAADNLLIHNSYNEMSARYAPLPDVNYEPTRERLYLTSTTNKQAGVAIGAAELNDNNATHWENALAAFYNDAEQLYQYGLTCGIPKELARVVIPVGRYSQMRASAVLRNWLAFLSLRDDPAAQWEIQQYAKAVDKIVEQCFPKTWAIYHHLKDLSSGG